MKIKNKALVLDELRVSQGVAVTVLEHYIRTGYTADDTARVRDRVNCLNEAIRFIEEHAVEDPV